MTASANGHFFGPVPAASLVSNNNILVEMAVD